MASKTSRPAPSPARRARGSRAWQSGHEAEEQAARHFLGRGYALLARRCRTPCGEIDLLVANEDWLIAVEVKQRTTLTEARYALAPRQARRLLRAFHFLIETRPDWQRSNTRLDVIVVDAAGGLDHIEDALRLY